jgi:hypothetical protein
MKNHRTAALCVCITIYGLCSSAQNQGLQANDLRATKPKLFLSLPEKVSINTANLNSLLNTPVGHTININLSNDIPFQFEGQVVSSAIGEASNIQTVIIQSTNYNGARLTLSKIKNTDGTIFYSGRILSFQHEDMLELKNQNGHYILVKRKLNEVISE